MCIYIYIWVVRGILNVFGCIWVVGWVVRGAAFLVGVSWDGAVTVSWWARGPGARGGWAGPDLGPPHGNSSSELSSACSQSSLGVFQRGACVYVDFH